MGKQIGSRVTVEDYVNDILVRDLGYLSTVSPNRQQSADLRVARLEELVRQLARQIDILATHLVEGEHNRD